jgi:hypothetical protein
MKSFRVREWAAAVHARQASLKYYTLFAASRCFFYFFFTHSHPGRYGIGISYRAGSLSAIPGANDSHHCFSLPIGKVTEDCTMSDWTVFRRAFLSGEKGG